MNKKIIGTKLIATAICLSIGIINGMKDNSWFIQIKFPKLHKLHKFPKLPKFPETTILNFSYKGKQKEIIVKTDSLLKSKVFEQYLNHLKKRRQIFGKVLTSYPFFIDRKEKPTLLQILFGYQDPGGYIEGIADNGETIDLFNEINDKFYLLMVAEQYKLPESNIEKICIAIIQQIKSIKQEHCLSQMKKAFLYIPKSTRPTLLNKILNTLTDLQLQKEDIERVLSCIPGAPSFEQFEKQNLEKYDEADYYELLET